MEKRFLAAVMAAAMTVTLDAIRTANTMQGTYVIGILQFAEHGSLDNCREGFL